MSDAPPPGVAAEVAPGIRRIIAPNPSPMTFWGTNTYLVGGASGLAVIDPGPDDATHLAALLAAAGPAPVSHIVVTHSHRDHSPGARRLARMTGAEVLAFGDATAGRSAVMQRLAAEGLAGGGEGVDRDFAPDRTLADGDRIDGDGWSLEVLHTPGHMGNHISLALGDVVLTGDHVMGWASSLVSPPDGDLTDFMASCRKLAARRATLFLPGHGAPVLDPADRLGWLLGHREGRERAILEVLATRSPGSATVADIARAVYTDTPPGLLPAAERNVLAHLVDLWTRGRVTAAPHLAETAQYRLA